MMVWKRIVFSTMEILVSMLVGWGCILGVLFLGEVWGMLSCGELWVCHREFWWQNLTFGNSGWGMVCCGGPWNLSGLSQSGEKANAFLKGSWGHCTHLNWPHCTVNLSWISAREIKGIASCSLPSYLYLSLLVEWFRFASAEISGMKWQLSSRASLIEAMKLLNDDLHEPLGRHILCWWVEALCFAKGHFSFVCW